MGQKWAVAGQKWALSPAWKLLSGGAMSLTKFIGIRHVVFQGSTYVVVLTRNESGTVSGQCMLAPTERPIIDGPSVTSVIRTIEQALEALVFVRRHKTV